MTRRWTVIDFILVILGGFLGAGVFSVASLALDNEELFIVVALVGQYVGNLFVLWIISRSKPRGSLGFEVQGRDARYLFGGIGLQLALSLIFLPLILFLFPEGGQAQEISSMISGLTTDAARLTALMVSVVVAPVTEELAFRGVLLRAMGDRSNRFLIVVSALVFSLFHVLGLATTNLLQASVVVLPQLFVVGAVLAWVTLRSNRLGPAIFIHSGFNLLAALVLLVPAELVSGLG